MYKKIFFYGTEIHIVNGILFHVLILFYEAKKQYIEINLMKYIAL